MVIKDNKGGTLKKTGPLFDELSKKFPSRKYTQLCEKLDVDYNEATGILEQFSNDFKKALKRVLVEWEDRDSNVTKDALKDALWGAEAGGLRSIVDRYFAEGSSTGLSSSPSTSSSGNSPTQVSGQNQHVINQSGATNSINASESASVHDNKLIGQQTNYYQSTSAPSQVHHHHNTTVVKQSPVVRVVPSLTPSVKRPKSASPGPFRKRQMTSSEASAGPSTSKRRRKTAPAKQKTGGQEKASSKTTSKKPASKQNKTPKVPQKSQQKPKKPASKQNKTPNKAPKKSQQKPKKPKAPKQKSKAQKTKVPKQKIKANKVSAEKSRAKPQKSKRK